jgi:uncharacterized YigZ family protein
VLFLEKYNEITADSKGYYTEKKSRFIGYCFLVKSKKDVITKLNNLKKREKGANHYCFAYVINIDQSEKKIFDDGEPNSTAGKPILQQIKSLELTNVLIVVVRYFGGTKLGIPGLIKAYKSAARNSLNNTKIITKNIHEEFLLLFKYQSLDLIMKKIKYFNLNILKSEFNTDCKVIVAIPRKKSDFIIKHFKKERDVVTKFLKLN